MKKIIYLTMAILLVCNIYIGIKYDKLRHEANIISEKYASLFIKEERISQKLKTFSILQQTMEGCDIPNVMIKNSDKESLLLSSLPQNATDAVLCFRFKETHCDACIQNTIRLLNEISTSLQGKIAILCGYTNFIHFAAFESKQNKNIAIYNVENITCLDIDKIEQSYFFIIQNGKIHNIFIPLKEDNKYIHEYIHILLHKYWNLYNDNKHTL